MVMRKYNVLVTGVGAIIGYGIIKNLRKSKFDCNIVGMDIYADAVGQAWCDTFVQAILASDDGYVDFIKHIMDQHNIDLVMFGTEQEISRLAAAKDELTGYYDKMVLNNQVLISLSNDKYKTYEFLLNHNFPTIPSLVEGSFDEVKKILGCPFLLKLRQSYSGKGMHVIHDECEFDFYKSRVSESQFMVQQIIGDNDHEYTAATFGFGDGTCLENPIIFRRKLSAEGSTAKAVKIDCDEIKRQVIEFCRLLKPMGPTNFQFRKEGEVYYLLEFNPRVSSSTSIRASFGYNEAEMSIDWFVNHQKFQSPKLKEGFAIRYIDEWVVTE